MKRIFTLNTVNFFCLPSVICSSWAWEDKKYAAFLFSVSSWSHFCQKQQQHKTEVISTCSFICLKKKTETVDSGKETFPFSFIFFLFFWCRKLLLNSLPFPWHFWWYQLTSSISVHVTLCGLPRLLGPTQLHLSIQSWLPFALLFENSGLCVLDIISLRSSPLIFFLSHVEHWLL